MTNEELGKIVQDICARYYDTDNFPVVMANEFISERVVKAVHKYKLDGDEMVTMNFNIFVSAVIAALSPLTNEDRSIYHQYLMETLNYIFSDLQKEVNLETRDEV